MIKFVYNLLRPIALMGIFATSHLQAQPPQSVTFEKMSGFPTHEEGIEKGVSACFAGVSKNHLLMAGGCNFPTVPAANGGSKRYYQGIYAARITNTPVLIWQKVGHLPVPCAYGVSIPLKDGLLCLGGNNDAGSLTQAFVIRLKHGRAQLKPLPALPVAMDNFTGSSDGNAVVVYDGEHLFRLDLRHPRKGWEALPIAAGAKLSQPVGGFVDGVYHVWGGFTAKTAHHDATLRLDGRRFGHAESVVPPPTDDRGEPLFLGGGAAISLSKNLLLAVGGVNKDVFLNALNHPQPGYLSQPISYYRFNPVVSLYDGKRWMRLGSSQVTARAGAALVNHHGQVYLIGGELKPGIRTPDIYRLTFHYK